VLEIKIVISILKIMININKSKISMPLIHVDHSFILSIDIPVLHDLHRSSLLNEYEVVEVDLSNHLVVKV